MARACDLSWAQLARVVPWGDSYEGITPGGQTATYERGYLWAEAEGGDVLVEVAGLRAPAAAGPCSQAPAPDSETRHGTASVQASGT
jgi:hypothetical protein